MNSWVEAPPKKGLGCFARGCLILAVFAILLIIACIAGMYWGMRTHLALARGFLWLTKVHAVADTAWPIPEFTASEPGTREVQERWKTFRKTVKKGQPAEIVLTAEDINNLIASSREAAGKAFVSIEDNRFRVQVSVPLAKITGRAGYFVNGDIMVQTNQPEPIDNPPLASITLNNEPVPADLLDWKYGSHRFRDYLGQWGQVYHAGTFEVRDGKVILRSGG
jgi:hypothetical protein